MKVSLLVVVLLAFAFAWGARGLARDNVEAAPIAARAAAGEVVLIDVRTPQEFASGHVAGAMNIPVDRIATLAERVPDRDTELVLYCRSGARSARAAAQLRELGYERITDLGPMPR